MTEDLEPGFEVLPQSASSHRRGRLWGSIAAVVVLAGGGAATYAAFAAGDNGSGSPTAAVQKVVADLQKSDLIGVLDDLAPGERTAFSSPLREEVSSLKRLGVLSANADPAAVSGVHFAAHDLKFADKTVRVNDHVQIVTIIGGTVDTSADVAKMPFTKRILSLVPARKSTDHADFTQHQARIAAQQVGGHWYASMFYTVADQAAGHAVPTASDRVPARGATSADAAVGKMVHALMSGDVGSALALVSPVELNAAHDYGRKIITASAMRGAVPATITTLDLTDTAISGGGVRVGLSKLVLDMHGQQISVTIDNGCARIATTGLNKRVCAADAVAMIGNVLGARSCGSGFTTYAPAPAQAPAYSSRLKVTTGPPVDMSPAYRVPMAPGDCSRPKPLTKAQKRALTDALSVITKLGVDTAKVDGSWYITPVRTEADLGVTVLAGLKGDDLFQLATLGR